MLNDELLIDEILVGDPDEAYELADSKNLLLTDDEIKGARMQVSIRAIEPTKGGYAAALNARFDPAPGSRFTFARVSITLEQPKELVFTDIAPTEVFDENPVKITVSNDLSLTLKAWKVEAGAATNSRKQEYTTYNSLVRGIGAGTRNLRWTFEENQTKNEGIRNEHVVSFTIGAMDPITISVQTTCSIIRPGLKGLPDRTRTLLFGAAESEGRRRRRIVTPPTRDTLIDKFFG